MTSPTPRPETIDRLATAVYPSFAMLAGMQLDLFTPLEQGPMSAEEIGTALGVGHAKLRPLLYALVTAGLLTVEGDLFSNTLESNHFLVRGKPGDLGGRHNYYLDRWGEVLKTAESIRTGSAQAKHEFSEMSQDDLESFLRGLHPATVASGRNLVARYDFSSHRSLLDVAGGSGGLAIAITEVCPQLRATVLELPTVTSVSQRFVDQARANDRVEILAGDVISGELAGSYDVAVLRGFIQVLSPDEARSALTNVGRIVKPGGEIYILGSILDDSRVTPSETVGFNLVFLNIYDGGQAYTEKEHRDWLIEAGFGEIERVSLPNGTGIIKAQKVN